jgi:ribosome-associated protein
MNHGERTARMVTHHSHEETRILVQAAAAACEDKKAEDTRILELDPADSGLSDFFLVTSATNDRQVVAIADEIEMRLKRNHGVMPNSVEGRRNAEWILLDYVDFVAHVFLAERRAFYDIERLRKSARPLTPAEFETELKHALADKTRAARSKTAAKKAPAKTPAKPAAKPAARGAKSAAPAKKKAAVKSAAAKKAPAKSAAKKAAAKKAPAKKAPAKKTAAKSRRVR